MSVVKGTIYTSQYEVGGYPRCMSGMYESDCQIENQNYTYLLYKWSGWRDLNPRPQRPERCALANCATPRYTGHYSI